MATFKIVVLKHQLRSDGKYPVNIRVTWRRESAYVKTEFYVTKTQLTPKMEIKDASLQKELTSRISQYEEFKLKISANIESYTAKELADYFVKQAKLGNGEGVDFIAFAELVICETKNKGTAGIYRTLKNNLEIYTGKTSLPITDINVKFLTDYEACLYEKRNFKESGVNLYLRTLRALFYKACKHYNDEDKGEVVIKHNPFKKFVLHQLKPTKKRNIKGDIIANIRDLKGLEFRRDILGRDVFMLSFYLLGMNTVDIYNATDYSGGRITYNRTKTQDRRPDKAVISVKVIPELNELMERYRDPKGERVFCFHNEYATPQAFNAAVNIGLKNVDKKLGLGVALSSYYARHSFATIARNICGVSMLDIHEALNHASEANMRVTDIYVERDWSVIDSVQRKVVDSLINESGEIV